jgi:ABC-type polar amino acid transport system ATPase subunit
MLQIKHVSKSFDDKKIVDNVSLDIPVGSITVLLGASGVGKSTMLRILADLEQADAGSILLNNKPIDRVAQQKEHPVGMVFQQFNLFSHKTVKQNITFPLEKVLALSPKDAEARADELLEKFGLSALARKSISALSGGQKQRLALARTLAMRPKIICMDEPTSALDPILTSYVAELIAELAKEGYTILIATHDTSILTKLDCTIYLMQDGKIIESVASQDLQDPQKATRIRDFIAGNHRHIE